VHAAKVVGCVVDDAARPADALALSGSAHEFSEIASRVNGVGAPHVIR
jgi:hypothetical protein